MGEWHVKYDGVCSRCGVMLRAGEVAVYERATRTIRCVSCSIAPDPEPPEIAAGVAGWSGARLIGAILAVTAVVLGLITRSRVSPV